jgi:predicted metal-dependent hydrolase
MNIVERAFVKLYPDKDLSSCSFSLKYSGKFSAYNANVKYSKQKYEFNLSKKWKNISEEIRAGLIQHLMQKVFKTKIKTLEQDLYDAFLKNVHIAVPKDKIDLQLKECFDRVNETYFLGIIEMPNLVFGQKSFRKLGSYEYGSDKITISSVFKNISEKEAALLDYVMFHEMLHKVHKYKTTNGRSLHHSRKFRFAEKQFQEAEEMEKALSVFLRKKKFRHSFGFGW